MTTSGTVAFNPSAGDFLLSAYARIGLRRSQLTTQHLTDAATEANLVQVEMANKQPNLWKSELVTVPLVTGTATYTLTARTISFMAVYLTVDTGDSGSTYDRILAPLSTFEYDAMPNKTTQAPPTSYWFNRQTIPTITMWPVPDDTATYFLNLQSLLQIEDVNVAGGATIDMPYRWLDAFTAKLAHRLARIYRPELEAVRKADADEAWNTAGGEDIEYVPMYILPQVNFYTRG